MSQILLSNRFAEALSTVQGLGQWNSGWQHLVPLAAGFRPMFQHLRPNKWARRSAEKDDEDAQSLTKTCNEPDDGPSPATFHSPAWNFG
jgi:hypothetical protein